MRKVEIWKGVGWMVGLKIGGLTGGGGEMGLREWEWGDRGKSSRVLY